MDICMTGVWETAYLIYMDKLRDFLKLRGVILISGAQYVGTFLVVKQLQWFVIGWDIVVHRLHQYIRIMRIAGKGFTRKLAIFYMQYNGFRDVFYMPNIST